MKEQLRKLWPDSLFGQLLWAMILGVAILQAINLYSAYFLRHSYNAEVHKVRYDYNSSIFLAMQGMDDQQREIFLKNMAKSQAALSQPFQFLITPNDPAWISDDSALINEAINEMSRALNAAGAEKFAPIQARVLRRSAVDASHPFYQNSRFPLLQIYIKIDADSWLKITQPMCICNEHVVWMQRLFILLESLVFFFVVILLIRRVTRPIAKLGLAAEKFGRNPETARPLEDTGSREIREAVQSFNRMRERIVNNMNERNRMLAAMSHDLRSPLARTQVRLEKIHPEALQQQFAANINEIQSIIQQGIELARSLNTSEGFVPLDIWAFVESIVDDWQEHGHNVTLNGAPADDAPALLVMARPTCLRRCLENILDNAVTYGKGAAISILSDAKGEVVIEVADFGPGIPEEFLEKVFEPYYRLEKSRNRELGGTGLGLSIARNMAMLNNGSISLANDGERGLAARIVLHKLDSFKADG